MLKYAKEVAHIDDSQFHLFASAITGRDWSVLAAATSSSSSSSSSPLTTARTPLEKTAMTSSILGDNLLPQLVRMLGQVPRIMLLIFKTNDLTRSLDESLHTRQGPVRSFLILAHYCARTVWEEECEHLRALDGGLWWPGHWPALLGASWALLRVELRLGVFEWWVWARRVLGRWDVGGVVGGREGEDLAVAAV